MDTSWMGGDAPGDEVSASQEMQAQREFDDIVEDFRKRVNSMNSLVTHLTNSAHDDDKVSMRLTGLKHQAVLIHRELTVYLDQMQEKEDDPTRQGGGTSP